MRARWRLCLCGVWTLIVLAGCMSPSWPAEDAPLEPLGIGEVLAGVNGDGGPTMGVVRVTPQQGYTGLDEISVEVNRRFEGDAWGVLCFGPQISSCLPSQAIPMRSMRGNATASFDLRPHHLGPATIYILIVDLQSATYKRTDPFEWQITASCVPDCTGKVCGDDGCGGSCGSCAGNDVMPTCAGNPVHVDPSMRVQAALDSAQPGDVITLAPGTYYESLTLTQSGTPTAPISLCPRDPGTVTISGATRPNFNLDFRHEGGDLYSAPVPWTVRWAMADGRNLLAYDNVSLLQSFRNPAKGGSILDGPPDGFTYENGRLYVRLVNGQDPNTATVEIHRDFPRANGGDVNSEFWGQDGNGTHRMWPPRYGNWLPHDQPEGSNIIVKGSHVVIAGLRVHLGPISNIIVDADDVTIRDSYFDGAWRSIWADHSHRVSVAYNEFSGYPTYQWVRWASQTGGRQMQDYVWKTINKSNLNINHVYHRGQSFRLENNLIHEGFDCLWPRNMIDHDPAHEAEYAHNAVFSCADEHIEFDTRLETGSRANWALNLRVHDNFLMDGVVSLALSPVQSGYLTIDHNIVYMSNEYALGNTTMLKWQAPWGGGDTQLVTIAHNTMVNTRSKIWWTLNTFNRSIADNNLFYTKSQQGSGWPADFTLTPYNVFAGPDWSWTTPHATLVNAGVTIVDNPNLISAPSTARSNTGVVINGSYQPVPPLPYVIAPVVTEAPWVDFRLRAGGVAVDAGNPSPLDPNSYHVRDPWMYHAPRGSAPDIGAIEQGDTWGFRAGPRWAKGIKSPWRPTLPPSLHPSWVGIH